MGGTDKCAAPALNTVHNVLFRRAGSSHAYVTVWPDAHDGSDGRQSLSVSFGVRPANVNVFVQAVAAAPLEPGVHAELPMAGAT